MTVDAEAQRHEVLLQAIFDEMVEGIVVLDSRLTVTALNRRFVALFDLPVDAVGTGTPYEHIIRLDAEREGLSDDEVEEVVRQETMRVGLSEPGVYEIERPDGTQFEMRCTPLPEAGTIITYVDITERKRSEDLFNQGQKMEAIGRLTAGVAHEFNNLLTAIGGFAQMLKRHADDPETVQEWAQDIAEASEQAAALTKSLLDFSHRNPPNSKTTTIGKILERTETFVRPAIGVMITTRFEVEAPDAAVNVDADRLSQAIVNLVINARDAMSYGGKLTIASRVVELDAAAVAGFADAAPGRFVAVSISDTGTGIEESMIKEIFEPFFTTKEVGQGTGLGLSMVYGMVQQSKGVITVDSEVDVGTTITIHLPLVEDAAAADDAAPTDDAADASAA